MHTNRQCLANNDGHAMKTLPTWESNLVIKDCTQPPGFCDVILSLNYIYLIYFIILAAMFYILVYIAHAHLIFNYPQINKRVRSKEMK